jgi:hypothetical protein
MILDNPQHWYVPKTVVGEELWGWVEDATLMDRILRIGNSDRKNLGRLVVITPKIEGLGKFARPLRGLCPVTFFGPGSFDRELYQDFFDLNPAQLNAIQKLKAREWCIKVDGETDGYFKKVILNLDESAYARATTTPQERAERQGLVEQYGYREGMKRFQEHLKNGVTAPRKKAAVQ